MKHTPGPWTNQVVRTSAGVCFKVGPFPWKRGQLNHACIYADYPSPTSPEYTECAANATLIAAAPELLEALKGSVNAFDGDTLDEIEGHYGAGTALRIKIARAAIAKATGEQP